MEKQSISKIFLIVLLIGILYACYLIFKPFLVEIIAAVILVTIFYAPYEWLVKKFKGRKNLAAFLMCVLISLLVIIPLANFMVYAAQESVEAYSGIVKKVNAYKWSGTALESGLIEKMNLIGIDSESFKNVLVDVTKKLSDWLVSGGTSFIKGTTNFIISIFIILFTMFFFFVDGKSMLEKIMYWTPFSNKYDKMIFSKFREVSKATIISTFVTAIAEGVIGAIGFMIIGQPAFFAGIAMGFLSLLPYFGATLIWLPFGIYLLAIGSIWQGVFLIIWGAALVGTVDNVIRAYMIKGKSSVHPIFIIFSILGGISLFGFWGIIFGPLIISIAVTILHIYEVEYEGVLER
jgi:predicted PurR-regulated permease PerM